jgi:hypothetical protein
VQIANWDTASNISQRSFAVIFAGNYSGLNYEKFGGSDDFFIKMTAFFA